MKGFLLSFLLVAFPLAAATISGTVVRSGTSTPLGGMTIAAYDTAGVFVGSTTTDAAGQYALTIGAGSFHLLAYDPAGAYATSFYNEAESFDTSSTLTVQASGALTGINFSLLPAGFIVGTVTSTSSAPLASMTIAAYNPSGTRRGFTQTDAAGRYTLALPPGSFKLVAYDDGLNFATVFYVDQATFAAATSIGVTAGATTIANFTLPPAAHFSGTVSDATTGILLVNVTISAYDASGSIVGSATTASSGQYRIAVRAGSYRLVFEDRSGIYATVFYSNTESFDTATPLTVAAGATVNGVSASMARGGRIEGHARDAASGSLLAGMTVAAYNIDGTTRGFTTTDAASFYSLLLPPGGYKIGAYDAGLVYAPQFYANQDAFTAAASEHIVPSQTLGGIDFALRAGGRLSGSIADRATGTPVAGIVIGAYDLGGNLITTTISKTDGSYRFVVDAGTYKLVAFDPALRYANAYVDGAIDFDLTRSVVAAAGQEIAGLNFAMIAGARVTGTVTDIRTGSAVGDIIVAAYDANGHVIGSATTDATGAFGFSVPPGSYRFVASDPLHRYATSYYQNAASFDGAMVNTVIAGQNDGPLTFRLTVAASLARRRAVGH